jgi:hypothetical protein
MADAILKQVITSWEPRIVNKYRPLVADFRAEHLG